MAPNAREVVMSYIQALDKRDYAAVRQYLQDSVFIKGPGGEAFRSNFVTDTATVFFCSWYQVKTGKIASIETIFDPRAFAAR